MKRHVVFAVCSLMFLVAPLRADAEEPCEKCRNAVQQELAKCIKSAISQEDKKSCVEKKDPRLQTCEKGVCKSSTGK
jgi:hypothetical protein